MKNTVYRVSKNLERTRHYMGGCWTFLAQGKDTNDQFALIEAKLRKGLEPPRHTHTREDETYYVLDGEMQFTAGEEEHNLKTGDFLYLPKNIGHHFKLLTDTVTVLIHIAPAGLDKMFWELSRPADRIDLPPLPVGPPAGEFLQRIGELQKKYGILGLDNSKIKAS